jgi:hypothetical protein
VFRGAFLPLAVTLVVTAGSLILLPLAILLGYPWLFGIGIWYAGMWYAGRVAKPAQVAAVWVTYLGLIIILHGIVIGFDTALAGAPPSEEQKRFGRKLAYAGGVIAAVSVVAAYAIELRSRCVPAKDPGRIPFDDVTR